MTSGKLGSRLLAAHRVLALILTPLLIVLCLSGMALAFQPMMPAEGRAAVDAPRLLASLRTVDPEGTAGLMVVEPSGEAFELRSRGKGMKGRFSVASGERLEAERGFDFFATAEQLHRGLLLGLNPVMEASTFGLIAILLVGPLVIGRLRLRTLMQRHGTLGLVFLPVLLFLPVSAAMMVLHLGEPPRPAEIPAERKVDLGRALELAAPRLDLSRLRLARRWPSGEVLLYVAGEAGREVIYKLDAAGEPVPFVPPRHWPHSLHTGRWAPGAPLLNMAGAAGMLALTGSGLVSWWRRRREERLPRDANL